MVDKPFMTAVYKVCNLPVAYVSLKKAFQFVEESYYLAVNENKMFYNILWRLTLLPAWELKECLGD